jgi:hypothetical protein
MPASKPRASRVQFRPQVGPLEQRALLSALPTLTAISASTASTAVGQSVTFTATVSDLSTGGATANGGTVTFSDQSGPIGSKPLVDGVAELTTTGLAAGTNTITASYGGTANFAPSATGTIVTAAGNGTAGYKGNNGPATAAELNNVEGFAFDSAGDLFIADFGNYVVRELVKATGDIITVAGNHTAGYTGDNGPATAAELNGPRGLAFDSAGDLFISDMNNNVIREVVEATGDIITVAGTGAAGYSGDGGQAMNAELDSPRNIAVDAAGDLFIADCYNNVIREVVKATGDIITVAGDGKAGYSGDNGPATAAKLNNPNGVAVDSAGDLFIVDAYNNAIREVVKATGNMVTVAGDGNAGYTGDGGPASSAELNTPYGVAVDTMGDIFIGDQGNDRIREVVKATGDIITVAGDGSAGYKGDNGPATAAELNKPNRVAIDSAGDLFVGDNGNNVVRELTPAVIVTLSPTPTPPTPTPPTPTPPTPTPTPTPAPPSTPPPTPVGPTSGPAPTRTVLTAQPRPGNLGRRIRLTVTVKNLRRGGGAPAGSVTFLDGTVSLGTLELRGGKATLNTSSLRLGANSIRAVYTPNRGFAPSAGALIEKVRAVRSRPRL